MPWLVVSAIRSRRVRERRRSSACPKGRWPSGPTSIRTYIGGIERGERNVALVNIVLVSAAPEVDPGELMRSLRP